uniref:hypothetical protein n=1 Tax=Alloprevotella sp. TaxID=1872471 RepID=UPI0040292F05
MKRKFISAMLFGALLIAPATTFVGCADYDDDIENLQGQITNNATTLDQLTKEKIQNVETEIESLKAANKQLQEALDKAKSEGTDADAATLAAAQKLVEDAQAQLQAALDAVNGDITGINGKISDLDARLLAQDGRLKSVESLLAADGKLTLAINDAQALAEKAYNLAEQTAATAEANKQAIKDAAANLKSIKESLEGQINTLSEKVNDLSKELAKQNADITAQINSLKSQLSDANEGISANGDKINKNKQKIDEIVGQLTELQNQVAKNKLAVETLESNYLSKAEGIKLNTSINDLKNANQAIEGRLEAAEGRLDTIDELIKSLAKSSDVTKDINKLREEIEAKIGKLNEEGKDDTVASLIAGINGNITTINGNIEKINKKIEAIEGLVNVLFTDLSNLITGVIYQDAKFDMVYGKITAANLQTSNWTDATSQMTKPNDNKVYFPSKGKANNITRVMDTYMMQHTGGQIYATINPASIDFNGSKLNLVDSEDNAHGQFTLGAAETANVKLQRAASKNGLYAFEIQSKFADNSSNAPVTNDRTVYALQASYKAHENVTNKDGKTENKEATRKIYSKYDIQLNPTAASKVGYNDFEIPEITAKRHTGTGTTWAGVPEEKYNFDFESVDANMIVTFTLKTDKPVYAKYIEPTAGKENLNLQNCAGLGVAMTAENENFEKVTVDLSKCLNKEVAFDYYIWNYDGSVEKKIYVLYVTRPMINAAELTETVKPEGYTTQTKTTSFDKTPCLNGSFNIWKSNANRFSIENVQGAALKSVKFVNAQGASVISVDQTQFGSKEVLNNHDKIKGLKFDYDPSRMVYGETYSFDVVFYNDNNVSNNLVNKVTIKYSLDSFGNDYADLISPLEKAFDKPFDSNLSTTIAWATFENGHATYKLNASFNHLDRVTNGCYAAIKDITNYHVGTPEDVSAYRTLNGVWFEKNANGDVIVNAPLIAVSKMDAAGQKHVGFVYDMKIGVKHYGLENLWYAGLQKNFKLVFKSPIYNARDLSIATKTVGYPGEIIISNNDITGYDPSKSGNVKINFLGASQDNRIAKMKVTLLDKNKEGYLVEEAKLVKADGSEAVNGIGATGIKIKAGGLTALRGADNIHFNLAITDVFGCKKDVTFTVKLDPNHLPQTINHRR